MSFRDFKEEMYLVLQIREGYGFGFATTPLLITANLASHVHESFITEPSPCPKFENVFVWVVNKNKLKSFWFEKTPVKVNCFAVNKSQRSLLGYVILNVKDAQIIQDESKLTEKQVRLLGVSRDISVSKPELIIAFYMTDVPISSSQLTPQFSPPLDGGLVQATGEPINVTLGAEKDSFSLTIKVVTVKNVKELLPSQSEVEPDLLTYTYSLLGAEIVSTSATNHSARLNITSSLACLKTYFVQQPNISVTLHMGSLTVGSTTLNIENFLLSEEVAVVRKSKQQSRTKVFHCTVTPSHNLSETLLSVDDRPTVDFSVSLGWETPTAVKKKSKDSLANRLNNIGAGGDADRGAPTVSLQTPVTLPLSSQSHSSDAPCMMESGGETYRTNKPITKQTVSVTVTSISLPSLPPNCWLRLTHPSASIIPTYPLVLTTHAALLQWHLTLSLPPHLLEPTLASQPPCLQLGTGDDQLVASALLHPPHNIMNTSECTVSLVQKEEKVGEVAVIWALMEERSESATTLTDTSLSPPTRTHSKTAYGDDPLSPRTRELKIHSFVEELEEWAEKKRIMVMEGLRQEEAARRAEFQRQLEEEASRQVSEKGQLVESLHLMRSQLLQRETELQEKQHQLKMYKEDLERIHKNKLQEFKDLSRRMQDEFNHKLALIAGDKVALEREVEQLRGQNIKLRQTLTETETQAEADKRDAESFRHELKVLKEKLQVEQESKKFFKDHCRKAEQEIHRLNLLRQQEVEARLHTEKTNLEQLAFQQFIIERTDFRQDQRQLEEIRRQLLGNSSNDDNNDVKSNSNGDTSFAHGQPLVDERHIRRAT